MLYEDMLAPVLLEARGCPDLTALRVMQTEVRQIYLDNHLWKHVDLDASIDTAGVVTFSSVPAEAEICEIRRLENDTLCLEPVTVEALKFDRYATGDPAVVLSINDQWTVKPAPAAVTPVEATVWLAPTEDATELPDALVRQHRRIYEHVTLARLLGMGPNVKWSNARQAIWHEAMAVKRIFEAKRKADGWTTVRAPTVAYGGI